ncbi:MAG: UDP-2,3-diacylglucosamine diphosphatase LpxI [Mariprofundaceae bacterium]
MKTVESQGEKKIGLIAGYGSFPLELARILLDQGFEVHVVAAREETSPEIDQLVASTCWLHVGQVGGMIKAFKAVSVERVIMAGKVQKLHLFRNFRPDFLAIRTLAALSDRRDDTILTAIADLLAKRGITLLSQIDYAGRMMADRGLICGPKPDKQAYHDMDFGFVQARGAAALDIGQTVIVQNRSVLAVEAIEGTDAAIARGGSLGSGRAVVVKVAKPKQDFRFDVPAVGPDTLRSMAEAGCKVLAIEAGKTIILERGRFEKLAEDLKIPVVGIDG